MKRVEKIVDLGEGGGVACAGCVEEFFGLYFPHDLASSPHNFMPSQVRIADV